MSTEKLQFESSNNKPSLAGKVTASLVESNGSLPQRL